MANPVTIINRIQALLKQAGIDIQKIIGTVDPNITKLVTKTEKTARKPKLIDTLSQDKKTFGDALDIFKNDAKYLSQMDDMELVNFANNLEDYFKVGGKIKYTPSNVVTQEGAPVVGKQLETLAKRKGSKGKADDTSLQGAMEGLMSLVDEMKGISPKMRNKMDRDELVEFIRKMRGKDFTNQEIKLIREYADEYSIGLAKKEAAPAMQYAKKLKAKTKDEFELIREYLDNVQTTSPKEFREMYGNVKSINMDLSNIMDAKLEKHFKKKYKWDKTKTDGGLDEVTFEKYEDELSQAEREFGDFHRKYHYDQPSGIFGPKSTSWVNNPKKWLDEASEQMKNLTGEGLNVDFYKNYTDDVLTKYSKPESFQYGGIAGMLGEPTYADGGRVPLGGGKLVFDAARRKFLEMMGGAAATGAAAKTGLFGLFKAGKPAAVETLTSVPIGSAEGMPVWFKPLVNKVIREGEDVTKKLATKEREIVHTKKLDDVDEVTVIQDLDTGSIRVEYQGQGSLGDGPIQLEYTAGEIIEQGSKKGTKTKPNFSAVEEDYYPVTTSPDGDFDIEFTENIVNKVDDLYSDTSKLKQFATGKNLTIKEISESMKKKNILREIENNPNDHAFRNVPDADWDDSLDFASGGRVPFKLGGIDKARRLFLEAMGAGAAGIGAAKTGLFGLLKGGEKEIVKELTSVPIKNVTGMPPWFKGLVNRVIKEGTETTKLPINKGGAYLDRQIVHSAKLGEEQGVRVYQNLDDQSIRVEYQSADNMGGVDDGIVHLEYKAAEEIEPMLAQHMDPKDPKGFWKSHKAQKTKPTFSASEAYPHQDPKDYKNITFEGDNTVDEVKDLYSDTSALKQFGTNKPLTKKELAIAKQKRNEVKKINEAPDEELGPLIDYPDEYASGGRVSLSSGGLAGMLGE